MTLHPDIEVFIVGCARRRPLIADALKDIPHTLLTEDFPPPPDWKINPAHAGYANNHRAHYLAFEGHKNAVRTLSKPYALIFEDDAVPLREDWVEIVNEYVPFMKQAEIVSFHGRQYDVKHFRQVQTRFGQLLYKPQNQRPWIVGSLAYLFAREHAGKLLPLFYEGYPIDLVIFNDFETATLHPSPFKHDTHLGSLVDTAH